MSANIVRLKPEKTPLQVTLALASKIAKSGGRSEARYRSFVRQIADMDITADEYENAVVKLSRLFRV